MTMLSTPAHPLLGDPGHPRLKDYVIEETGLTYYSNRDADFADRVSRRLSRLGLHDCGAYLRLLQDGQMGRQEFDSLVAELTIGETYFFRHPEMFEALRNTILPELIERKKQVRRLRIWSAGCATGPEAYSLAILLKRELGHLVDGWEISILGTDINRGFLSRAIEGRYEEWAFRSCPDEIRENCFERSHDSWLLKAVYRNCVSFQYHNLVKHPIPSLVHDIAGFDLIMCRNVMIYFGVPVIRRLLAQFEQCLVDEGWLLVGHAEPNTELFQSFRAVNAPGATLYRKLSAQRGEKLGTCLKPSLNGALYSIAPAPFEGNSLTFTRSEVRILEPAATPVMALEDIRTIADQGNCEGALRELSLRFEQERLNPAAHFVHALVLEQLGRHVESERALRQAIYLDRNFVLAHYYLGLRLQHARNLPGARKAFGNVLALLTVRDLTEVFEHSDGITAGDLRELTEMNLEVVQRK